MAMAEKRGKPRMGGTARTRIRKIAKEKPALPKSVHQGIMVSRKAQWQLSLISRKTLMSQAMSLCIKATSDREEKKVKENLFTLIISLRRRGTSGFCEGCVRLW